MTQTTLPRHVAIIMDGNGRWAKKRMLPRLAGHKAGVDAVRETVKTCAEKGIEVLTLFAFSSENWQRPAEEVSHLMELFFWALEHEAKKIHKQNIQLRIIGDRTRFSTKLQAHMQKVEDLTANNTGMKLVIAANYGGLWDITEAARAAMQDALDQQRPPSTITSEDIQAKLSTADLPQPDLFIRTSGEQRISNFMIWQFAYTELYFTEVFWPDFNAAELEKALTYFSQRERRFGLTSEQVRTDHHV